MAFVIPKTTHLKTAVQNAGCNATTRYSSLVPRWTVTDFVFLIALLLILLDALVDSRAEAQTRFDSTEYKFEAVYIYNFLQFIQWPAQAFPEDNTPMIIGVLGKDPFGANLHQVIQGEILQGRNVIIRYFPDIENLDSCHLLFISRSEKTRIASILSKLDQSSVLTVSDIDGFTEQGGGINFFIENGKLLFKINLEVVHEANLKISSKLLRLAKVVNAEGILQDSY